MDALPFHDGVDLVRWNVFQCFDLAGGPAYFDGVDFRRRSQAEMKTQIVLRKVTATAAHFVELGHSSGVNGDARADRCAITLCSLQTEEHTMVRDFIRVEQ